MDDRSEPLGRLDSITPQAWIKALEQAAHGPEGTLSGRKVICIKKGEMGIFEKEALANDQGYKKLKLMKLIKYTSEKMKQCEDSNLNFRASKAINAMMSSERYDHDHKKYSMISKLGHKLIDPTKNIESSGIELIKKLGGQSDISPEKLERLNEAIENASAVRKSVSGMEGVLFLESDGVNIDRCVIKLVSRPADIALFEMLLQSCGFITPESMMFSKKSEMGDKICQTLSEMSEEAKNHINNLSGFNQFIQVSNMLNATPFDDLNIDEFVQSLQEEQVLQELGKMAAIDCVMGNDDRIQIGSNRPVNFGNFMLSGEEGDHHIALIDNEPKCYKDHHGVIKIYMEQLFAPASEKEGIEQYFEILVTKGSERFIEQMKKERAKVLSDDEEAGIEMEEDPESIVKEAFAPLVENKSDLIAHMRAGLKEGVEFLLKHFDDEKELAMFSSTPLVGKIEKFDPAIMRSNIALLKKLLEN